ncbi:cilia- and flagella-associated protein 61-like isoform X2 [Mytilus galloprovincialis]|uniref:cilia- and flagella-associated protein 61-like isoform X1 n=1 Tax=Mytilus galloprovincialis TaxID=29158 RepID=UPI003F7B4938
MATITPVDGPPEVVNARRTESLDAPHIIKLVNSSTDQLFGRVNVVNLIEKAVLAVTLCNDKEEILGHAAFFDYPNIEGVDPSTWEEWFHKMFDTPKTSALNSLYMHYFVAKKEYASGCAREIIRTAFNAVPDLHYLFLNVPMKAYPDASLDGVFQQLPKREGVSSTQGALFACYRHNHVPVLHVRKATVEDHDDLTPIFNRHSDMLKMAYGDFFLAELIEAQDDHMQCLVAEVEGTAVGFMSISNDVNTDMLNECFELGSFHGLKKPHQDDDLVPPKTPTPSPPPELAEERPASKASSTKSAGSAKEAPVNGAPSEPTDAGTEKKSASRQSSKQSSRATSPTSELKVEKKLSDAHMRESSTSLLSEGQGEDIAKEAERVQSGQSSRKSSVKEEVISRLGTPKPITPMTQLPKRFVPIYKGAQNAFSIQLFCIDERYEMRSSDFLSSAFELFPQYDFCVITVPHLVPEFPLIQGFVRITPRSPSTLPQELYVFHRSGLLKDFHVRPVCSKDLKGIEELVKTINFNENLIKDIQQFNKARRDEDGTEIKAFVAQCQDQIVGVAVIRREENIEYIRSHYNIEDFIYYNHHKREEHGHLHHFALNPVFTHMSKMFIKEILRQGKKTSLYFPLYPAYTNKEAVDQHSLVTSLNDMVPVRARRQITYPLEQLAINAPSDRVLKKQEPYALNHVNRKLVLEPKVTINARIVVVGASNVGIGFLEQLAYCPHLRFNNLTLVSPHGLPGEMAPDELRDQMLGNDFCYGQENYANISLRTWINVVYGKMTNIDRKKKLVIVNNGTVVPYDHLIISVGLQYQIPAPTDADLDTGVTNAELPNPPDRRYFKNPPKNLFTINDAYDAAVSLYWIENYLLKSQRNLIIYGSTLDAFCCAQTLLTMGVPGERIHLVQPPLLFQATCFNNPAIDSTVVKSLESSGVHVYSDHVLAQWNDGADDCTEISSASFTTNKQPTRLECGAFFSYYKKAVDFEAFRSINDACLVYDGKLVIDSAFHTNDVSIRGAGTITKFQRKYHADQWTHANFNSKEVGVHLATEMLRLFDPTMEPQTAPPEETLNLIPIYRNPKIQGGVLPGGYNYLHIAKPGLDMPLADQMAQHDYGKEYITGATDGSPEYFRIHVNQYNNIETITCVSKSPIPCSNFVCLYGLHERCLNNLVSRFNEGLIKDFYTYFLETWSLAMYHDRFTDFRDEVRELLSNSPEKGIEAVEEKVRQIIDEDVPMNESQKEQLLKIYQETGTKRAVDTRFLSFLSYNYYHLPMYAKPGMV